MPSAGSCDWTRMYSSFLSMSVQRGLLRRSKRACSHGLTMVSSEEAASSAMTAGLSRASTLVYSEKPSRPASSPETALSILVELDQSPASMSEKAMR